MVRDAGKFRRIPVVARCVRALPEDCALRTAQSEIDRGRYYGSGLLVRRTAEALGHAGVRRDLVDVAGLLAGAGADVVVDDDYGESVPAVDGVIGGRSVTYY